MRISILAALMAASALIPSVAAAQDFGGDRGNRGGGRGGEFRQNRADGGQPRAQEPRAVPQVQQQQRVEVQQPQARPNFQDRGSVGGWAGRGDRQEQAQRPQAQGDGVIRRQIEAMRDRGRNDSGQARGNGDWRNNDGNRPDRGNGGAVTNNDRGGRDGDWRDRRGDNRNGGWAGNRGNDDRNGNWRGERGGNDARNNGNWRDNRGGFNGRNGQNYNDHRAWNRDWRRDGRYNWNDRRARDRNAYHLPRYYAPYGWNYGYRRFSVGLTLNSILFNQNYWIDDAYDYGLPEPYGPYRWVRYYNDALLVDIYSGEVVDTVYDIFW